MWIYDCPACHSEHLFEVAPDTQWRCACGARYKAPDLKAILAAMFCAACGCHYSTWSHVCIDPALRGRS
jgi:hypothetical protein